MSVLKLARLSFFPLDDENESGHDSVKDKKDNRATEKIDINDLSDILKDEMRNVTETMFTSKLKSSTVKQDLKEILHRMRHAMSRVLKYLQRTK